MQNLREAAQQALGALEQIHPGNMTPMAEEAWNKSITAIRAALSDATCQESRQVEPVAWISYESLGRLKNGGNSRGAVPVHTIQSHTAKIPLYTAQPKREPLTDEDLFKLGAESHEDIAYAAPTPQRAPVTGKPSWAQ